MNLWSGPITIAVIFLANNNWKRYLAWKAGEVRLAVIRYVSRRLAMQDGKVGCASVAVRTLRHRQSNSPQL
jgi:hypothetical protein